MTILISDKPEMNVVNVGDELTQDMIDALNSASGPSSTNVFVTKSAGDSAYIEKDGGGTVVGTIVVDTDGTVGGNVTTITGTSVEVSNYGVGTIKIDPVLGITFPDNTSQATASVTTPSATTSTAGKVQLATTAEAIAGTDATKATTLDVIRWSLTNLGNLNLFAGSGAGLTSGTGATATWTAGNFKSAVSPTTAVGYGIAYYLNYFISGNTSDVLQGYNAPFNWSKKHILTFRIRKSTASISADSVMRVLMGGRPNSSLPTTGNLTSKGIGIVGLANNANWFFHVHDGTTLRTYDLGSSVTTSQAALHDFSLVSDGEGNAYCYVNGILRATSINAPTGQGASLCNVILLESQNTNTVTSSCGLQAWQMNLHTSQ